MALPFELRIEPGDQLGERYVVERFLGQGAMGIVLAVRDEELGTTVAAKVLRPLLARSEDAQSRFRREVTTARRVTHPNVCRIYDLGYHRDPASRLDLPFFTMELLEGPTLSTWIDERGRLDLTDALELVRGIVAGLDAAHRAGIVHRDFKSSNVVIVPEEGSQRTVLTDFGLSRSLRPGSKSPITQQGQVLGTPAFISPEQLRSQPVTPAADIYALGVMLYQMTTGRLPFLSNNPVTTAMIRLQRDPEPPSRFLPGLDPRWERTILHCLQREPGDRPPTVLAVLAALEPPTQDLAPSTGSPHNDEPLPSGSSWDAGEPTSSRRSPARLRTALGFALGLGLLLLGMWLFVGRDPVPTQPSSTASSETSLSRPTVAVATLRPLSAPESFLWIGPAIAEMLTTEIGAATTIRPLPRAEVARAELAHPAEPEVADLAIRLNVDYLVDGTFLVEGARGGETLRIDLRLQDRRRPLEVRSWSETSPPDQLVASMQVLGVELRQALGGAPLTHEAARQLTSSQPGDSQVAELLTTGRTALRANDGLTAEAALTRAVELQPDHPILHAELGRAWRELGYDARAAEQTQRAVRLADRLPRDAQLLIQAQDQAYRGEWIRAAETYEALSRFYPDDEGYARRRTEAWIQAGVTARAEASWSDLSERFAPDVHPDTALLEASIAALQSDVLRIQTAAQRALDIAQRRGERLLEAEARRRAANAARRLGQRDSAREHLERAHAIYRSAGDSHGIAQTLLEEARLVTAEGDSERAERLLLEARTTFEAVGAQRGRVAATLALASLSRRRGDHSDSRREYESARQLADDVGFAAGLYDAYKGLAILDSIEGALESAERSFEESLRAARDSGNLGREAAALNNLAIVLSDRGEVVRAESHYREALERFETIGHLDGMGSALNNLAILQWDRADLEDATATYERSLDVYQRLEEPSSIALALANLAEVQRDRGDLDRAAQGLERAITMQDELQETLAAAKSRALLALVRLDQGRPEESVALARQAVAQLQEQGIPDDEAIARTVLAKGLGLAGRDAEGQQQLGRALALADRRENPAVALWVAIEALRQEATNASVVPEIVERASALADSCREAGLLRLELEARQLQVELLEQIDPVAGESRRSQLESDVAARGFHRLATSQSPSEPL